MTTRPGAADLSEVAESEAASCTSGHSKGWLEDSFCPTLVVSVVPGRPLVLILDALGCTKSVTAKPETDLKSLSRCCSSSKPHNWTPVNCC